MELNWLLCNQCFLHMIESKSPFSMTQCGHLFCRKCLAKAGDRCPICGRNGVQTVSLSSPLPPVIASMFDDVATIMDKLTLSVKFQKSQLNILMNREQELTKKYSAIKASYWQLTKHYEKLNEMYNALKTQHDNLIAASNAPTRSFFKEPSRDVRVTFARQNMIFGDNQPNIKNQSKPGNMFRPLSATDSADSDTSNSTIRGFRTPRTSNGGFLIPTATRIPRSVGTSTPNSRMSTPMSLDYDQNGSDTNPYSRRRT